MEIIVNEAVMLDRLKPSDDRDLVSHLNKEEIARNTLQIPYPYTYSDANEWLDRVRSFEKRHGIQINWAIRRASGQLIGCIGLHYKQGRGAHKDEIGYWLAKDFWNRGIMTAVVTRFTEFCFKERGYIRLEAPVFAFNKASARVLEKAGFIKEGVHKKFYCKNGNYIDCVMYAKVI